MFEKEKIIDNRSNWIVGRKRIQFGMEIDEAKLKEYMEKTNAA